MSEVADWSCLSKCAHRFSSRTIVFSILGITTIVLGLCQELIAQERLGDKSNVFTQPLQSTKLDSRLHKDIWDEVGQDTLGWRTQNQTRGRGQTKWESDYVGWHPRRIDSTEFTTVEAIQPGRLELVRHPEFGSTPVLVKIADAHEATIYRLLYDLNITPPFLGHVTQHGKVVGIITEFVQRPGKSSLPGPSTRREACLAALRRMHARGIAHRDAHGENCLLREDGSAALIDFELSAETSSRAEYDRDLWIMYHTVAD